MPRAAVRTVKESQVQMVQMVLPTDTNRLGNLLGGQLMHWIDIAAAIAAARHANRVCVTASVDEINFHHPIQQGDVVTLQASVNRVFRTSLEIGVRVTTENLITGKKINTNTAYLTFVAIDEAGKPTPVAPIKPLTKEEKRRYADAADRRELRLHHRK
jgi:acyl-CoA hydrolase